MKLKWMRNELDYKPDWKRMSPAEKRQYVWDYYKIPIAILLILVCVIGHMVYRYVTRTYPVLYVAGINVDIDDALQRELTDGFQEAAALGPRDRVICSGGMSMTADETSAYLSGSQVTYLKILGSITGEMLDIVLMDKESFDEFSLRGYLADLEKLASSDTLDETQKELLAQLSPSFTVSALLVEDNAEEAALDQNVEYKAVTEDHMYGIDLSGTALFGPDAFPEPVYLGIISSTPRMDMVLDWLAYVSRA